MEAEIVQMEATMEEAEAEEALQDLALSVVRKDTCLESALNNLMKMEVEEEVEAALALNVVKKVICLATAPNKQPIHHMVLEVDEEEAEVLSNATIVKN